MQIFQTWERTQTWDPTNPNQQPLQFYSPADMGYRSAYWNEVPTSAKNLMGILPENRYVQAGAVLGLGVAAFFGMRYAQRKGLFGLSGPRRRRRR